MTHNSARENGSSSLKRGRQGQCYTVSIAGRYTGKCRDYKSCSRQSPGSARRGNPEGNRVTRHVTRHPCIKNPPGGPKVSRGARHTNKNNKNKEKNNKIQENHNKKRECTLPPTQQQDGQAPHPAEGKVLEPCGSGDQELIAPPPPPEQIRKR